MRVLILGGTAEARALAAALVDARRRRDLVAGRPGRRPRLPVGEVRIGGFGGRRRAARVRADGFDAVVDATHPFSAQISANAAAACRRTCRCCGSSDPAGRTGDRRGRGSTTHEEAARRPPGSASGRS